MTDLLYGRRAVVDKALVGELAKALGLFQVRNEQ
jgi:hypothetical protein